MACHQSKIHVTISIVTGKQRLPIVPGVHS